MIEIEIPALGGSQPDDLLVGRAETEHDGEHAKGLPVSGHARLVDQWELITRSPAHSFILLFIRSNTNSSATNPNLIQ